jgi:hypothetical protein
MSHITIIIGRAPSGTVPHDEEEDRCSAQVEYRVPHDATDVEVGQAVKRLYRQVKNLGAGSD